MKDNEPLRQTALSNYIFIPFHMLFSQWEWSGIYAFSLNP